MMLKRLIDNRNWPDIPELARKDARQFAEYVTDFFIDYEHKQRGNLDDLQTLGVVCSPLNNQIDKVAINWLADNISSEKMIVISEFLQGYWQPSIFQRAINEENIRAFINVCGMTQLNHEAQYSYLQLLQQLLQSHYQYEHKERIQAALVSLNATARK